jgi:cobalt-zinc-cadmium efflux system outer membrane protein
MKAWKTKPSCLYMVTLLMTCTSIRAQDTMRVTLPEVEQQFVQKNLRLLANKYGIEIARAQVIQARLYNNPNLGFAGAIYNPQDKKWFDLSNESGQYAVQLQQMIILAGKRNKQVKLATTNVGISENLFYDLLRTLRFTLRSDFYNVYYLQNSLAVYEKQISWLQSLDLAYDELETKGVVSLKDAVRIRSLLYSLRAEQVQLQNQVNDVEAEMQLLLQNNKAVFVAQVDNQSLPEIDQYPLQELIDTAYQNRGDLKAAQQNLTLSQQNYSLQKALAVPDLNLGAAFDKRGTYTENATLFNVAIDLPFFNRNQGNIKASKIAIDQSEALLNLQTQTVENDVQNAYKKALNTDKMLRTISPRFKDDFDKVLQGVLENFQKKNISLIEFTDFYDAYRNNVLQLNQLQNAKMQAIESLNFSIGKTIINP